MGNKNKSIYLIPVMLCFFCMGFVDLVGIASGRSCTDRLCSKCIPVAGILLVPHLQCADGYADE